MASLESSRQGKVEFYQKDQRARVLSMNTAIELHGDEFWTLSGKPYFHVIIAKSNLHPFYQLVVPASMHSILPSHLIPTVLTYGGKTWEMKYYGDKMPLKRIYSGWKVFAIENNLKAGDACVFELMGCSRKKLTFKAQILRDDIPSKFLCETDGKSADAPIVVE